MANPAIAFVVHKVKEQFGFSPSLFDFITGIRFSAIFSIALLHALDAKIVAS